MKYYSKKFATDLILESGEILSEQEIAYHSSVQEPGKDRPVIWVMHALTANSDVSDWWNGLYGAGRIFDPEKYDIVCANILGSPYGSTNALSWDPRTGEQYFHDFPDITIRDIVSLHIKLANELHISQIELLVGGSLGGQQALEWAITEPPRIKNLALLATNAYHSPWGQAWNASQRMAIASDESWAERSETAGLAGLKVARSIALLSYRTEDTYRKTQETEEGVAFPHRAESYQKYQGEKLAQRFHAFAYWTLSRAMDSHDVGRRRSSREEALALITAKTLIITLQDDLLFPRHEQEYLSAQIVDSSHAIVSTDYGHDGFLLETDQINHLLQSFLDPSTEAHYHDRVRVGLLGLGTVGSAVYEELKASEKVVLTGIAIRDITKPRSAPDDLLTDDAWKIVHDIHTDVIIELIDDAEQAFAYVSAALKSGKSVVSANKKMISTHRGELAELERIYGGKLLYEAAVAAAIPILRSLKSQYQYQNITKIEGIVNGSTNYILTRMLNDKMSYEDALSLAQREGFAESDPSLDVDGWDAAYKLALLAYEVTGIVVDPQTIPRTGITDISYEDLTEAQRRGDKVKLIASLEMVDGEVVLTVSPQELGPYHALYGIDDEINGLVLSTDESGEHVLVGRGAGGAATGSSVLADLWELVGGGVVRSLA